MKKIRKTNLRWWGMVLILAGMTNPVLSQLTPYPLPGGLRRSDSELTVFQDALYMVLYISPVVGHQLCKFDGVNFTIIPNPGYYQPAQRTPLQVFQGNLYLIMDDFPNDPTIPPPPALFRFDGTTFSEVVIPYDRTPSTLHNGDMKVYDDKLYLDVSATEMDPVRAWVTYDGTDFSLIGLPSGMTDRRTSGMKVLQDKLYCMMKNGLMGAPQLVGYDGISFDMHAIAGLVETKGAVYDDKLILTQLAGGIPQLIAFDGTSVSSIAPPAGYVPQGGGGEVYNGSLFLRMANASTPDQLMAYDGATFTHVATIGGLATDFEVWDSKLWFTGTGRAADILYSYAPPPTIDATIYDFEHIDFDLSARDRGWCWNEIVVDWGIPPFCLTPPNCPEGDSPIAISLQLKGKEVWQSIEKKPFNLKIPECNRDYKLSLSVVNSNRLQNLITIDPNLVGTGVENVKLGLKPKEGTVNISLSTIENQAVPVTISFLNNKGIAVWQEQLVAPDEKHLNIKSKEPGARFVLSPTGNTLESAGITAASYYPNPFEGKITVDIRTKGDEVPVLVTIDDPNGKRVVEAKLVAPIKQTLEIKERKPGFYVLTFHAGKASRQALIELK